jgi:Polysaccharide deacetylase
MRSRALWYTSAVDKPDTVALTVDVERDWAAHGLRGVREALPRLLELLDALDGSATFFVVGDLADEVRGVLDPAGRHEVGSHGLTHRPLPRLPASEREHEVRVSRQRLVDAGYEVEGFRAPFYASTPDLPELLRAAGYGYDASLGTVLPKLRRRPAEAVPPDRPVASVPGSRLADGRLPANLTSLRLSDPVGRRLLPRRSFAFSLHLHELVGGNAGWARLPAPVRRFHGRRSGAPAWALLRHVLDGRRIVSCRELLGG